MEIDMHTRMGFDIAGAIRGPDVHADIGTTEHLKALTTGVIRHAVAFQDIQWYTVLSCEEAHKLWELYPALRKPVVQLWQQERHFRQHIEAAVQWLPDTYKTYFTWLFEQFRITAQDVALEQE